MVWLLIVQFYRPPYWVSPEAFVFFPTQEKCEVAGAAETDRLMSEYSAAAYECKKVQLCEYIHCGDE